MQMIFLRFIILIAVVVAAVFILYPPLGRKPSKASGFRASDHYRDGKFFTRCPRI